MSIELTPEQSRAVAAEGDAAVVVDPLTRREYRLVSADVFHQWQASHPDATPWTPDEMARLAGAAFHQLDDDDYGHYLRDMP